jgi:hypothetical protein
MRNCYAKSSEFSVLSGYSAYRIPKINMTVVFIHMEKGRIIVTVEILMVVTMKHVFFWVVTICSLGRA